MKIKVIDLLNKIANGEEVPKRIKFYEVIYTYDDKEHGYCRHRYDNTYICLDSEYYLFDILNDEVEIIEEEKKPITKEDVEALGYACGEIKKCFVKGWNKSLNNEQLKENNKIEKFPSDCFADGLSKNEEFLIQNINQLKEKVNEIIDVINKMKENK